MKNSGGEISTDNNGQQSQHNDLYHWIYVAGATIALGFVNFFSLYPEDHRLSFLVLSCLLSLVAVYELHSRGWSAHIPPAIGAIFCVPLAIFAIIGPNLPEETNIHGRLIPDNINTPLINCAHSESDAVLILGTNAYVTNYPDRFPVFNLGTCAPLHIHKTPDGIAVDFNMYTPQRNLIARMLDNEWHLVPSEYSYQEHPDRSTLQVFDKTGEELFFVRYLNRQVIWIRGRFSCGSQPPIIVDNDSITTNASYFVMGSIAGPTANANFSLQLSHGCFTSHFGAEVLDMENNKPSIFTQAFDRVRGWFQW